MTRGFVVAYGTALTTALALRGWLTVTSLLAGKNEALLRFPLGVIFPSVLAILLLRMEPTATREGMLMRVGTCLQLLLIVLLPGLALYLALGLPVVFLAVELFETRLPPWLRDPVARLAIK